MGRGSNLLGAQYPSGSLRLILHPHRPRHLHSLCSLIVTACICNDSHKQQEDVVNKKCCSDLAFSTGISRSTKAMGWSRFH
uniref:Uncharacterized protein n=1 Tax=Arundo donax TaxID=35708 RepID=A0A0A9D0U0_ARUDO